MSKEVNEERTPRTVEDVKEMLTKHSNGEIQRTIQNCITILQNDHVLADAIRLNLLSERIDIVKPVGWPRSGKPLNDTDMKYILRRMEKYGISSEKKIESAIRIVANENRYHPIRDYLNGLKWDGTGADALMIPAGGMRMPASVETSEMKEDSVGNFRSLEHLVMKGDEVFNFVQREVPPLIEDLLYRAACGKEEVDWYMFHQPNRFMLHKLADKLGVPHEKMPSNIVENFGNASGATIPTNISFNIGGRLKQEQYMFCLAGFGVGLTWGALLMKIGNLDFNEIIYY